MVTSAWDESVGQIGTEAVQVALAESRIRDRYAVNLVLPQPIVGRFSGAGILIQSVMRDP